MNKNFLDITRRILFKNYVQFNTLPTPSPQLL